MKFVITYKYELAVSISVLVLYIMKFLICPNMNNKQAAPATTLLLCQEAFKFVLNNSTITV